MKQNVILLAFVVIFSITYCYGQKVTKSTHGAIIDASAIPHTTLKKARETDGTNEKLGSNTIANIGSRVSNEKVYRKFEVYKEDIGGSKIDWLSGINLCKNLSIDGGGWRVPTSREYMLMWILVSELERIEGFRPFVRGNGHHGYISATEVNAVHGTTFYIMYYDDTVLINSWSKSDNYYYLRCIRDL